MNTARQTIAQALHWATRQLHQSDSDSARLDAEVLLAHLLECKRSYLYTWPEQALSAAQQSQYRQLIQQRQQGQPVAYLTGYREFWSMRLKVSPHTLIPRPETEQLVELALARIPQQDACRILDLGTGSGAIALAIAQERPSSTVYAVDLCERAIHVARANAAQRKLSNLHFIEGNWCQGLPDQNFDVVVSNPPYIAEHNAYLAQGDVRFEPKQALVAGITGLEAIDEILKQSRRVLKPAAWLLIEHGYDQAQAVAERFRAHGFDHVEAHQDLNQQDRVCIGRGPG